MVESKVTRLYDWIPDLVRRDWRKTLATDCMAEFKTLYTVIGGKLSITCSARRPLA